MKKIEITKKDTYTIEDFERYAENAWRWLIVDKLFNEGIAMVGSEHILIDLTKLDAKATYALFDSLGLFECVEGETN